MIRLYLGKKAIYFLSATCTISLTSSSDLYNKIARRLRTAARASVVLTTSLVLYSDYFFIYIRRSRWHPFCSFLFQQNYLMKFGYLPQTNLETGNLRTDDQLTDAIKNLQVSEIFWGCFEPRNVVIRTSIEYEICFSDYGKRNIIILR